MDERILIVDQINKKIRRKHIIKNVSMDIKAGEVLGFLGPNGAGKSTTLRMIVGLSKADSGSIIIAGHDISKNYVKAMQYVGCMIEGPDMYNNMSGYKNLEMLSVMGDHADKEDLKRVIELVGLENRIHDKVRVYSMGMKQRLGLAAALLHKPKLLVLDEPTNGLDPQGIYEFREIVQGLASEGIGILISSHLISEVQLMCDKVSIINNGEIIRHAPVETLLSSQEVVWRTSDNLRALSVIESLGVDVELEQEQLISSVDASRIAEINRHLHNADIDLVHVAIKEKTLEELFLELTENQKIM